MKKISLFLFVGILVSCSSTKELIVLSGPQVTSSAKELVRITDDVVPEFQPALSPNGKELLYVIRDDAKAGNDKWSIRYKKNVLQPGFTPLIGTGTYAPSWINNNGDFIFTYYASNPVIATSNINRLGITYIGQNAYGDYDTNSSVSPSGNKIVLTTTLQGSRSICLVNNDGSSFTVLSEGSNPVWHPSGNIILYSKLSGDYTQLFELDLDSYQSTQITTGEANSTYGAYSPDGSQIAFISDRDNKYNHLFIMKRNGQSVSQLTNGNSEETQPFWGTDGFVYFSSNAGAKRPESSGKKIYSTGFKYADIWRVKPLQ